MQRTRSGGLRPPTRAADAKRLGLKRRRLETSMKFELRKTARGLSDDELLEDLRRVARKLGRDTVTISEYTEHGLGHATTIQRRFRSWFKALEDAGLKPSRSRIGISDEELFANLRAVWMSLGRQPSYGEIKTPLSQYSAGTYGKRFGSWSQALQQFVEWVNADEGAELDEPQIETESPRNARAQARKTKREISERMRFRILVRDGFRCGACGASPLENRGTELHVDHIVPWSKGGETVPDNLATKCSRCNLGKGDAFEA
ncbi:MAG: HNH endonuclease [Metallibacterium scheffleri]|nr:HNH endonuclease [Metallibacterium scheffleri]